MAGSQLCRWAGEPGGSSSVGRWTCWVGRGARVRCCLALDLQNLSVLERWYGWRGGGREDIASRVVGWWGWQSEMGVDSRNASRQSSIGVEVRHHVQTTTVSMKESIDCSQVMVNRSAYDIVGNPFRNMRSNYTPNNPNQSHGRAYLPPNHPLCKPRNPL